jgi:hypothetical protein
MTTTTFTKHQTVRVAPACLERMTAVEKRRLSNRQGIVQAAFIPEGRLNQVVTVQWLARNNTHTFGQPESWSPTMLELVVPPQRQERT